MKDEDTWIVKKLNPEHNCGRRFKNRFASSNWLGKHLVDDVRSDPNVKVSIIKDQVVNKFKGLTQMFDELMPGVDHRFCVQHLYNNFSKDYKGKLLKGRMWVNARATNMSEFQFEIGKIKKLNIKAWEWLVGKEPRFWTRAAFRRYPRCDALTNNGCENFNSQILEYRGKTIITMLEEIRLHLMAYYIKKKEKITRKLWLKVFMGSGASSSRFLVSGKEERRELLLLMRLGQGRVQCVFYGCSSSAARSILGVLLEGLREAAVTAFRLQFNQILVLSNCNFLVQLFNTGQTPDWDVKTLFADLESLKQRGLCFSFRWSPAFVLVNVHNMVVMASNAPIHYQWPQH
ncbi:hypothetical protein SO802_009340 [Lithocarpus litseifolius]|uniref:MULE transposase domain-containing protein n=1 Tax=Lithocarpus litseifolius TaxID=425828 RepID=A0AAW2DDZ4_9ROSI